MGTFHCQADPGTWEAWEGKEWLVIPVPASQQVFSLLTPVAARHNTKVPLMCRKSQQWCYSTAISVPQIYVVYVVGGCTFLSSIFILFFKKDWWTHFYSSLEFNKLELSELCFTCSHVCPGKEQNLKLSLFLLGVFLFCDKHKICSWCHESSRCGIQLTIPSRKLLILPGRRGDTTMIHVGDNAAGTQVQLFAM